MLPLGQCTYEQSRMLVELLAPVALKECGDSATITRHVTKRGDKSISTICRIVAGRRSSRLIVCARFLLRLCRWPLVWD